MLVFFLLGKNISGSTQVQSKMADSGQAENSGKEITVTVKTPKEKQEIKINGDSDVKKVYTI